MDIRLELESQLVFSKKPAEIRIYVNGKLTGKILANVEYERGADNDMYPCAKLKEERIAGIDSAMSFYKKDGMRVELSSQSGTSVRPAEALIYCDNKLVVKVSADIEEKAGADQGLYPCVILKEEKLEKVS